MARIGRRLLSWSGKQGKLAAAAAVGLVLGAGGMAWASIPDTQGVIHGCYKNNNGTLRIIDTQTESCGTNETAISWSQAGPAGPAGPEGPAGPSGGGSILRDDLAGANLNGASFAGFDLSGRDFSNARFGGLANLNHADLSGANFSGAFFGPGDMSMRNVTAHGTNFEGAHFGGAATSGSDFTGANLRSAEFLWGIQGITLTDADLTEATIHANWWPQEILQGEESIEILTSAAGADLTGTALNATEGFPFVIRKIDFTDADFTGVQFNGGPGSSIQFDNSVLVGVDLTAADLTYVEWIDTVCPDGTNSADHSDTCVGHLAP